MLDKRTQSVMQKNFSALPAPKQNRSKFNLSHSRRFNFNPSDLMPVLAEMMIPGDTFRGKTQAFIRLATQRFPTMDNARVIIEAFFMPFRLTWSNFQRAMGERDPDPDSSIDYTFPVLAQIEGTPTTWTFTKGSLGDAFGMPVGTPFHPGDNDDYPSSPIANYFRGYNKIWNDWYRSDSLQDRVPVHMDDGPDTFSDYVILKRGKPFDYFTSALPWPQRGDAIPLPLGTFAPVVGTGTTIGFTDGTTDAGAGMGDAPSGTFGQAQFRIAPDFYGVGVGNSQIFDPSTTPGNISALGITQDPDKSGMIAVLSDATGATINLLRDYVVAQQMLESLARSGSLYRDQVKAIFGVTIPDFRLQRAEYVGGNRATIGIHSVPQTSPTTGDNPQAGLGAYGTGFGELDWSYSAVEHGILYVLMSVSADLTYQQQMRRQWTIRTQYDIFRPEMAHLGERPILNEEIFYSGNPTIDKDTWGYQEPWAEYRFIPSLVSGDFRSFPSSGSLDVWHWAQDYDSLPELGPEWIVDDVPMERSVAVQDEPLLLAQVHHTITAARPIPLHSFPGLRRL